MSDNRRKGLATFAVTGLSPVLVDPANLEDWVVPRHPLHPAFKLLSPVTAKVASPFLRLSDIGFNPVQKAKMCLGQSAAMARHYPSPKPIGEQQQRPGSGCQKRDPEWHPDVPLSHHPDDLPGDAWIRLRDRLEQERAIDSLAIPPQRIAQPLMAWVGERLVHRF
jgi:hypothetical protein